MSRKTRANLMLLALAMIWGGSFVSAKLAMESFDPYFIMVLRFFIGALAMFLLFPKERKKANRATVVGGAEIGLLLGIGTAFQMVGLQYTTPANQTFIIVSYVITVPLIRFLVSGIRPGKNIMVAAVFTVIGVGFLTLGPDLAFNRGDVFTFIMALLFAVQIIRIDGYMPRVESAVFFTTIQIFVAGIVSAVLFFIRGADTVVGPVTAKSMAALFYLVVLNTAVAYYLQNGAQRDASPDESALIISSESLFGTFAAYFFAGEEFYPKKIIGCVLILAGQFVAQVLPALRKIRAERRVSM